MTRIHRCTLQPCCLRMITTSKSQVPDPTSRPPTLSDSEEMFGNSGEEEVGDDLPHIRHSHNNSVSPLLFASLKIYKAVPSAIRPGLTLIPGLSRAYKLFVFHLTSVFSIWERLGSQQIKNSVGLDCGPCGKSAGR